MIHYTHLQFFSHDSIDNSEWSRNGDFSPSRFQAQADAITIIAGSKTGQNAETGVGIVDITGPRYDLHSHLNASELTLKWGYFDLFISLAP